MRGEIYPRVAAKHSKSCKHSRSSHTHTLSLCAVVGILKLAGQQSVVSGGEAVERWVGGVVGWIPVTEAIWCYFFFLFNAIYILQITMTLDIPSSLCFSLPVSTLLVECLYFVFFPVLYPVISSNKTVGDRLVSYFRRLFFSHSCAVLVVPWPKPSGFSPQDGWLAWPVAPDGLLNRTRTVTDCLDGDWMNLLSLTV